MYVPNYVPEPEAMPGNVTQEPYAARLRFIRQTLYRFTLWVLLIAVLAYVIPTGYAIDVRLIPAWAVTQGIPPVFRADHPFVFLIQDDETGNILFIGRVVNPVS